MKIFIDIFSGDEVLSDAMNIESEYDDAIISVKSKMINPDDVGNIDIGNCNEFGGDTEADNGPSDVVKVNNIITNFSLEEFFGSKKEVMALLKERITEMREKLADKPDRLKLWEKGGAVEEFVKKAFGQFDECQFYMGKSYGDDEPKEGMLIIAYWVDPEKDTGETFFFFKDCLRMTKV